MLTCGSLFDGIGCFSLAFVRAGFRLAWSVEKDSACRRVTAARFPGVTQYDDVCTVGRHNLEPVDLVLGGFPCQDLSVAGKRAGLAGERSGLWGEFRRVLAEIAPRWCLVENVPGLLSSNGGRDLGALLWQLGQLGYWWAYRCLDAQYDGLAQRRKRVFIVGRLGDAGAADAGRIRGLPARVLFESESLPGYPPPRREAGAEVAPSVTPGARRASGQRGGEQLTLAHSLRSSDGRRNGGPRCDDVVGTVCGGTDGPVGAVSAKWAKGTGGPAGDEAQNLVVAYVSARASRNSDTCNEVGIKDGAVADTLQSDGPGVVCVTGEVTHALTRCWNSGEDGTSRGTPIIPFDPTQITSAGNYSEPKPGDPCHPLAAQAHAPAIAFQERGRKAGPTLETQEDLAYALLNPGAGSRAQERNVSVGTTVRRLTPVECLRLMGLPDDFLDVEPPLSDSVKYRQIGNGGSVPTVQWIAARIAETEATGTVGGGV